MSRFLQGIGAAFGLAIGQAALWHPGTPEAAVPAAPEPHSPPTVGRAADQELARFQTAVSRVMEDLETLQQQVAERAGAEAAAILGAQALMAQDPELQDAVTHHLHRELPLEQAVQEAGAELAGRLEALADPYFRQRAADVRDLTDRLVAVLTDAQQAPPAPYARTVLVAAELPPSAVARLDPDRVVAIITAAGGATSHSALLAKGLGIPAVVACSAALTAIREGDLVAVDGTAGTVVVRPDSEQEQGVRTRLQAAAAAATAAQAELRDQPAVTPRGDRVLLAANVASARAAQAALAQGAEGVGLFRTEFLFLGRPNLPGEEEQFAEYRAAAAALAPRPVVIRILDIGGDKPLPGLPLPPEENPFLGWRGIRLWLDREDVARPQIRALLRAARFGNVQIMLPMVTGGHEVRRARALLEQVGAELGPAAGPYRLGVMIETPAAALVADQLAAEVDFFSIGTNDLVQYTLAVDRGNPQVASLFDPLHPAVLRLIRMTVQAARRHGIPVAVCGDAAADPRILPALVALGVDELSVPAAAIAAVKQQIRGLREEDLAAAIRECP